MSSLPQKQVRIRSRSRRVAPVGATSHLVEIAQNTRDPDVLVSACRWAVAAGALDQDKVHRLDAFRSILSAWSWRATAENGAALIKSLELDVASALSTPDSQGETGADIILDAMESNRLSAPGMIAWLELMKPSDWLGWAGEKHSPPGCRGEAAYSLGMTSCQDTTTSVLSHLFSQGLDPNLRFSSGRPLAAGLTSVVDLEAFMAAGGDLRIPIGLNDHGQETTKQLWEHLRKTSDLRPAIDQWSSLNEPAAISEKLAREYWDRLQGYVTAQEITQRAKSHPQWDSIVDEKGQSCAVYLLRLHQSCHRFLSMKQSEGLLSKRDHQGRDLWFHALSIESEKRAPVKETLSLLASKAPRVVNPVNGRGLLAEILLDEGFKPGLYCAIDVAAAHSRVMKALPASKWLSGSDEDMEAMCNLITRSALGVGDRQLSKFNLLGVSKVLLAHASEIEHPGLCWTSLVALAESNLLKDLESSQISTLAARSGKTDMSKDDEALLEKHASAQIEFIRAGLSANGLAQSTVSRDHTSPATPRF